MSFAARSNLRRRGSIYVLVLSLSLLAATMAAGGLLASRSQARAASAMADTSSLRLAAQSGIELARLWIRQDANWRTTRSNGTWATDLAIGTAAVRIDVVDPLDGDLANRPHDSVKVTATATRGAARQSISVTLLASPTAMPILANGATINGQLRVKDDSLLAQAATIAVNGDVRNERTIEGNVAASSYSTVGRIRGSRTTVPGDRAIPPSSIAERYAALGTQIGSGSDLATALLTPTISTLGTPNPDGIYVIRSTSDVKISKVRIVGTLVVICPGKKLVIDNGVVLQSARPDYPALIADAALVDFHSNAALSESSEKINFNPAGVPYNGISDGDQLDTYPPEISGLVHVTGMAVVTSNTAITGALVVGSSAADALRLEAALTLRYTPSLLTNPPQYYTTDVQLLPQLSTARREMN